MSTGTPPPPPPPRRPGQVPLHRLTSDPPRPTASRASSMLLGISSVLLSTMMIVIGLVLLLPGMCAGYFLVAPLLRDDHEAVKFFGPWIFYGFAIAAVGVVLIVAAVRLLRSTRK